VNNEEWRRAVRPASKPGHYNVRIISRAHDGSLVFEDLVDVPDEEWREQFGVHIPVHHHPGGATTSTTCGMFGDPEEYPEGHLYTKDWADVTCDSCLADGKTLGFIRTTIEEFVKRAVGT
jgi:hypothetical protein